MLGTRPALAALVLAAAHRYRRADGCAQPGAVVW